MLLTALPDLALVALVAALSPFPLIASIVAASAEDAAIGVAFAAGWVAGLGALVAALVLVAGEIDPSTMKPDAWVQVLIGGGLLVAAVLKWAKRPRGQDVPPTPGWMASLQGGPARAFGVGAALGAVNPKHVAIAAAAAAIGHAHGLFGLRAAIAAAVFVAVGSSTVLAIVIAARCGGPRVVRALDTLKGFMLRYSSILMAVLFAAIGAKLVYEGLKLMLLLSVVRS